MPAPYNFFGQSPAPQAYSPSPQELALAMQLPEYNNATPANAQPSQSSGGMGGINPQMLAKLMQSKDSGIPADAQTMGIPADAQSYNTGTGPLPWLQENTLPWQKTLPWLNGGS